MQRATRKGVLQEPLTFHDLSAKSVSASKGIASRNTNVGESMVKKLLAFLFLCFAASAFADTTTVLKCGKAACPQVYYARYYVEHVFPQSIDGNGTVTAYVDSEGLAGYGRGTQRTDSWYIVQWDNTGTLTSAVFSPGGSAYVGLNAYKVPIPENTPGGFTCCQVTNGNQSAYAQYVTNLPYWQGRLVTP